MESPNSNQSQLIGWIGRIGGPCLAIAVYLLLDGTSITAYERSIGLNPAQATAAIAVLMAVWWMTEAVPLPITSLLPLILFPLTGVLDLNEAAPPYANKFIFLFLGGFMIARAVEKWNLHRRIALFTVLGAGTQPTRLIAGFMIATAGLSMWISNTASTVMMLPIGMSLVALVTEHLKKDSNSGHSGTNFATCMMLGIAYSASIGGLATLVGTPTNLFLAGFTDDHNIELSFSRWMLFATPLSIVLLFLAWILLTRVVFPIRVREIPGGRALISQELAAMGRMSRGEWVVLCVFALTATAWVLREPITKSETLVAALPVLGKMNDTIIALIGACSLFLIPIDAKRGEFALDWDTAVKIPWGVLLLFGGGFCLAEAVKTSGLAQWIGEGVSQLNLSPLLLMILVTTLVVFLTELTSNTPTAATFLPILFGVAQGMNVDPMLLLVPATLAATCAFMLPVATPPNAIVFGSGHIEIRSMAKAGVWLNILSIVLIVAWMWLVGTQVFGITT
ncbi:MAG: anion transporter [Planctomycetaceae bacterium]|nr:anion transporter [Planctomycetaceae bacterium]